MIRLLSLIIILEILFACARQTTPDGGPKDLTPPKLLNSNPVNNQKNFKDKTLTFSFSELVKLKDPKEEIIITPQPPKDITYLAKQNRIIIASKTGWLDSTTYSLAFRDGVQDVTESNPAENLRIAFSTGAIIDSLSLYGKIVDALTEKIPEKLTVAIIQSDTFNIFTQSPKYFTKTNKAGRFVLTNLKPGTYRMYAFEDKNKNLKLETKTEAFGFLPGHIELDQPVDSLTIITLHMDSRPIALNSVRHTEKISTATFNKPLLTYSLHTSGKPILNTFGTDQSEIKLFHNLPTKDSVLITFHGTDSLTQQIDTTFYVKAGTNSAITEKFTFEQIDPSFHQETAVYTTTFTFNKPITLINYDSVRFKIDSATVVPVTPADLRYDTSNNKIYLTKTIDPKILSKLEGPLNLFIGKASFISIENDSSKSTLKSLITPKPEDTATLLLEIQTTKTDYEIQLITTEYKIIQTARNAKKITFKNIPPAEYKLRVYIDLNKNNQWDPGNINLDIPPEPIFFYRGTSGKYQFPLRANWEVGPYTFQF